MEKKLKELFDYQRFEDNPRIAKLISETEARMGAVKELRDDELFMVSAAGEFVNNRLESSTAPALIQEQEKSTIH